MKKQKDLKKIYPDIARHRVTSLRKILGVAIPLAIIGTVGIFGYQNFPEIKKRHNQRIENEFNQMNQHAYNLLKPYFDNYFAQKNLPPCTPWTHASHIARQSEVYDLMRKNRFDNSDVAQALRIYLKERN